MPVGSVAELINLLAGRRQGSILHDRRTGMPYSWSNWLQTRASLALSSFSTGELTRVMAARPAAPTAGVPPVQPLWLIILAMFWHGGDPPPRDQRGLRWFAGFFSAGLHVLFAALLLWVALVRSAVPDAPGEQGERTQIQYVGSGTPGEAGGGTPDAGAQQVAEEGAVGPVAPAPAQASPAEAAAASADSASFAPNPAAAQAQPEPTPAQPPPQPSPPVEQPLQVTEVVQPTRDFVLPPMTVAEPVPRVSVPEVRERSVDAAVERPVVAQQTLTTQVRARDIAAPEVQVRERQVETSQQQTVQMAQVPLLQSETRQRTQDVVVREREVQAAPARDVAMAQVRQRDAAAPQLQAPAVTVRERQLPGIREAAIPAAAGTASSSAASSAAASATPSTAAAATSGHNAAQASPRAGTSVGAGPKSQDRSGGWDAPVRGDDWGAAARAVDGTAGGQADQGRGLFNADGSVRMAADDGNAGEARRGAPGGDADSWSRERIANSGTWLKRPPYGYTPTSFDKYWVPNESLLAEWVRKGIKDISIPIPGTSTSISCVVSMLQFGGGCSLSNPNMQEQPAEARPPPDIPFKKELQEDNGSR